MPLLSREGHAWRGLCTEWHDTGYAIEFTLKVQRFKQFGNYSDFITLSTNPFLPKSDTQFGREGADDVGGASCMIGRPMNRFAIHSDLPI